MDVCALRHKTGHDDKSFYSVAEYNVWWDTLSASEKSKWRTKYYKGLGTSSAEEAREYFRDLGRAVRMFTHDGGDTGVAPSGAAADPAIASTSTPVSADAERLDMAFRKVRASDRRDWLASASGVEALASRADARSATDAQNMAGTKSVRRFVDTELVEFAAADNIRSIPSVVDGLKPSQRKVRANKTANELAPLLCCPHE